MAFYVVEQMFGRPVADETAKYIEYRRVDTENWVPARTTSR